MNWMKRMPYDRRTTYDFKRVNSCLDWDATKSLAEWAENKRALVTYGELVLLMGNTLKEGTLRRAAGCTLSD